MSVAEALAELSFSRLTHFTPARSLWHIVRDRQVTSSKDLASQSPDCFAPTDLERFDDHPEMICCNFEFPNAYYLSLAQRQPEFTNYPDWVCLLLDRDLVLRPGALFCPCNAARACGAFASPDGRALLDCFAPVSAPDARWRRGAAHHPAAATDLQAEALIPGPVALAHVRGIVVYDREAARQLYGTIERYQLHPERFDWIIAPIFFDKNMLSNRIRYGGRISESSWSPTAQQEMT